GAPVSYPLIVGGRVFVAAQPPWPAPGQLYAFDRATGSMLWGPVSLAPLPPGTAQQALLAADNGRIYVKTAGVLHTFDAQNGTEIWSRAFGQEPSNYPVAAQGQLYAGTARFDEETGALLWRTTVEGVNSYLEDVAGAAVYVTTGCENAAALAPADGTVKWF